MILIFGITFVMAFLISLILFNGLNLKGMVALQKLILNSEKEKLMKSLGLIVFILILLGIYRIMGLNFYSGIILGLIGGGISTIFKKDTKIEGNV
ncbi:hypothetical protein [Clostridium frigidicarnis]|uniref:Uncharacterized protein n=1 Tax=Clostridium frigidicarnis TaxID=84698 RepID=A0A1I0XQW7_9CLOT|nr:hypothetical protein [Clostridium frigidicarnis]SFB03411.1 hypothetical protein SAMN04488528_100998 [Clostridium frigidicarnis]